MKYKKLIFGLSSIGILAATAPISFVTTNQVTFANSQSTQMQSLPIHNKLTEIESINKSCENLGCFQPIEILIIKSDQSYIDDMYVDSRIKIEDGIKTDSRVKEGKIERDNLFTCTRTDTQYTSYFRYKSNNIEKNNHTSWGNAKKYQLNVTVPANTKEYKVQVVADVKIKNCLEGAGIHDNTHSFAQAKLSQLSKDPKDTLMPYIGINDGNIYSYFHRTDFKIITQNDLFRTFNNGLPWEKKPYQKATLSSAITLSNETTEVKEIPVYFWYGFFGGGYSGEGFGSHINCSEVTFSASHIK